MDDVVRQVIAAWVNAGPRPDYHQAAKEKLRREWPTLANALDRLTYTSQKGFFQ